MFQVFQLSTMSIGQASKSPELTSQGQIAGLDVAGADITRVRPSVLDDWDRSGNPACGPVPFGASNIMAAVNLDELRVVYPPREMFFHRRHVPAQPVCRELKSTFNSFAQVLDESMCVRTFA